MFALLTTFLFFLLATTISAAPVKRALSAPTPSKSTLLGYASDASFNPSLYRDGGGGGCLTMLGTCLLGFSDSFTTGGKTLMKTVSDVSSKQMSSFAHNSFAAIKPKALSASATALTDFGTANNGEGTLLAAPLGAVDPTEAALGAHFAIWPNGNLVPLNAGVKSNQLVGVANALNANGLSGGTTLYNTLYTVDVTPSLPSGQNVHTTRLVPQLFQASENLYGTFALTEGHDDAFLYLWSAQTEGALGASHLKLARVPAAHLADKSQYTFWDGKAWSAAQPSKADTSSAVYSSPSKIDTGEAFYSSKLGAWALVTSNFGEFRMSVAPAITGPWSAPTTIYKAEAPADHAGDPVKVIYAGHAYPDWDPSGESLLLSWTLDENWTQMAVVEF